MISVCPICGSSEASSYLESAGHKLVKCAGCALIRVADFRHEETSYDEDGYFTARNQYVQRWDEFSAIFDDLMLKISRFRKGGKLLDVGAGVGCLVATAIRHGFDARGVELSSWASRFAREEKGLDIFAGLLEDTGFEPESFDVVVINHVIEHLDNPLGTLSEIRRLLKPDGLLVVGVPNIGSIMAALKGGKWGSIRPEEHIWHFKPSTLRALIIKAGFKEVLFESKDNYAITGFGWKSLLARVVETVAVITNRSEAMIIFCVKDHPS